MPTPRPWGIAAAIVLLALGYFPPARAGDQSGWLVDDTLRHIGNNRYQPQCGAEQFQRVGVWGPSYSLPVRIRTEGQISVVIEEVWGVNAPATVRFDDRVIDEIPVNADLNHPRCGQEWRSRFLPVTPGVHQLTIDGYRWPGDIDDVAFRGIRILTDPPDLLLGYGTPIIDHSAHLPKRTNWLEVLMDTTTLLATVGLLAFMVERLTHGLTLVLSYSSWWRARAEPNSLADPLAREAAERNRRVLSFLISAVLAIAGALWLKLDLLLKFGVPIGTAGDSLAGPVVTGLLLAAGADPIRDLLKRRDQGMQPSEPAAPIQVTGTLVLQQTLPQNPKSS